MVGMEKVMIIVKAVVSTPASNPVKIRIAEGCRFSILFVYYILCKRVCAYISMYSVTYASICVIAQISLLEHISRVYYRSKIRIAVTQKVILLYNLA